MVRWPLAAGRAGLWEQSVDLADRCLYAAKEAGRNAWVGLLPGPAPQQAAVRAWLGEAGLSALLEIARPIRVDRSGHLERWGARLS